MQKTQKALNAVEAKDVRRLEKLLSGGVLRSAVDVNFRHGRQRMTLLHHAATDGTKEIVEVLLRHGADVNAVTKTGRDNALHYAISWSNSLDIATMLVDAGAIIDLRMSGGGTCLSHAAYRGNTQGVEFLLQHGAVADLQDEGGNTALYSAAMGGRSGTVKLLIEHGADVNIRNKKGRTPLHAALQGSIDWWKRIKEYAKVVKILVSSGADVNIPDATGTSVLDVAIGFKHDGLIKFLKKRGALEGATLCRRFESRTASHIVNTPMAFDRAVKQQRPIIRIGDSIKWYFPNQLSVETMTKVAATYDVQHGPVGQIVLLIAGQSLYE